MIPEKGSDKKEFLVNKVLLDPERDKNTSLRKPLSYISGERVNKPLIYVGMATCGRVAGAESTFSAIREYLKDHDTDAELIEGGCNGLCSEEPLVDIQLPGKNRLSFSRVYASGVESLLDEILNDNLPELDIVGQYENQILRKWDGVPLIGDHPFFKNQERVLLEHCGLLDPVSVESYIAKGGYCAFTDTISKYTPAQVCEEITKSGLRGRGGGGYPTGRKLSAALNSVSEQKFLVCNAVESDPGSYMNRAIIESNPHRLIESVLITSYAIGATRAYIFIREEFSLAVQRLEESIEQARNYGLIGHNIFDSGVNINIVVKRGARAFVCGEETALNNSIEGKRAMPVSKPPYPAERGLWDKPTIVNNVETLFNIPLIMYKGPDWFAATGNGDSKGTKLFTISGSIRHYGTAEVPMGIKFREILLDIAGGIKDKEGFKNSINTEGDDNAATPGESNDKKEDIPGNFKAVVLGINSGSYITKDHLDTRVSFGELEKIGAALGSGAFVVLDRGVCMVDLAKYFTAFFKRESCGKCIPCREGTARMLEIMENVTRRPAENNSFQTLERFKGVMQLRSLAGVISETSLCSLGKSSPNPILNTLKYFKEEFDAHIFERRCDANVCTDLRIYTIDVDACTGCTACFKKCPVDAIIGSPRYPHFIVQDKCIACGSCYDACKFNAVIIK